MRIAITITAAAMLIAIAALSGCGAYGPTATELDYGNSVRHVVQSQTLNPPSTDTAPVDGGDGDRVRNALEVYRTDVAQPEDVKRDLIIGVGGNR